MNQRLTRKEIKRNELVEALERSASFVERNARALVIGAVALAVALIAAFGVWSWLKSRAGAANEALTEALEVYRPEAPAEAGDDPALATAEGRRARAAEMFQAVRDDYGFTDAADVAAAYLGQIAAQEGDPERARELWEDVVDDHGGTLLGREVRLNLIVLGREQGRGEEVVADLEAMLAAAPEDRALPGDVVLYELALTYEELGRDEQAASTYRRLIEEYPRSAYVGLARQKAPAAASPLLPGIG